MNAGLLHISCLLQMSERGYTEKKLTPNSDLSHNRKFFALVCQGFRGLTTRSSLTAFARLTAYARVSLAKSPFTILIDNGRLRSMCIFTESKMPF